MLTECGPNQFKCTTSGLCVGHAALCDAVDDCRDRSDELRHCGMFDETWPHIQIRNTKQILDSGHHLNKTS